MLGILLPPWISAESGLDVLRPFGIDEQTVSLHKLRFFRNWASRFSREGTLELWKAPTSASTSLCQFRLQSYLGNYPWTSRISFCSQRTFLSRCCSARSYSQTCLTRSGVTAAATDFLFITEQDIHVYVLLRERTQFRAAIHRIQSQHCLCTELWNMKPV